MTLDVVINLRASVCYSLSRMVREHTGTISRPSSANLVLYAPLYTPNKSVLGCPSILFFLGTGLVSCTRSRFSLFRNMLRKGLLCPST